MTLRIKSPLRSAEGTTRNLLANPVLVFVHIFTNTAYCRRSATRFLCGQYPHSLGYFPMQRPMKLPLLPPPRPPFYRRRLCICGGSYHIYDDTAAVFFGWSLLTSAHSEPRSTSCQDGTKRGEKTKKTRTYTHGSRETPKSERRTFAKKWPAPMYKYESISSFR